MRVVVATAPPRLLQMEIYVFAFELGDLRLERGDQPLVPPQFFVAGAPSGSEQRVLAEELGVFIAELELSGEEFVVLGAGVVTAAAIVAVGVATGQFCPRSSRPDDASAAVREAVFDPVGRHVRDSSRCLAGCLCVFDSLCDAITIAEFERMRRQVPRRIGRKKGGKIGPLCAAENEYVVLAKARGQQSGRQNSCNVVRSMKAMLIKSLKDKYSQAQRAAHK